MRLKEATRLSLEALQRNGHHLGLIDCETTGKHDIPVLKPERPPERLIWIGFNSVLTDTNRSAHGVHFFIDDYLFERAWNDPKRYAALLRAYPAVLTADFSMFIDYPKAVQIYNHWRKHQLGAYWQSLGIRVYPSICWSDHDSYDWCFDGEPVGGVIAVSSVGTQKSKESRRLFMDGYREALVRLKPEKILFFGDVPDGCDENIERYDAFYKAVNARRKAVDSPAPQR